MTHTLPAEGDTVTVTLTSKVVNVYPMSGEFDLDSKTGYNISLDLAALDSIEVHKRPFRAGDRVRQTDSTWEYIIAKNGFFDVSNSRVVVNTTPIEDEFPHELYTLVE